MRIPITFREVDTGLTGDWPSGFTLTCLDLTGSSIVSDLTTGSTMYEMANGSYVIDAPNLTDPGYLHIALTSRPTLTWYETWFDVTESVVRGLSTKIRNLMLRVGG